MILVTCLILPWPVVCFYLVKVGKDSCSLFTFVRQLQKLDSSIFCSQFDIFTGISRRARPRHTFVVFLRMTQQLTWQLLRSLSLTKTMLLWFGVVVVSERNSNFFWPWQQGKKHGKRIDLWHNFKSRQFSTTVCVKSYNL